MPVKLIYCYDCQTYTNHHKTPGNLWVCWCGCEVDLEDKETQEVVSTAEWLSDAEIENRLEGVK